MKTSSGERKEIFKKVGEYYKAHHAKKDFIPGKTEVPVGARVFDEKEMISLVDAALDFWLTEGRFAKKFSEGLGKFLGVPHVILTNSGSSANLLAFSALCSPKLGEKRIKPGDEVLGVGAAFPTTVNPVIQNNCVPVLLDINVETLNVDASQLEKAVTKKTKAIFLAHSLGNPFDLNAVMGIAKKYNLFVIEDCCDALGSQYNEKFVGTFGDIATFSFYPAHHITTGEGGALVTKNALLRDIIKSLREWGREWDTTTLKDRFSGKAGDLPEDYDHRYVYSQLGYNLKLTDIQAAIGVPQIQKLPRLIAKRRENFSLLSKGLQQYSEYLMLPKATPRSKPSWFAFPISVRENRFFSRKDLVTYLETHKVATRMFFAGNITKQPYFKDVAYRVVGNLTNTDIVMRNTFWIGVYPGITKEMIRYVIKTFDSFFHEKTVH